MSEEKEHIDKCQQGELSSFTFLYDKYIDNIYKFVYYRVQHKQVAEDLTSQVFMKALEKINKFKANKGTFSAWLYQIARNTVIDHYRTSHENYNIEDIWGLYGKEDVERDLQIKTALEKIDKYLEKLTPEQRQIVIMKLWDQMTYKEIAAVMNKSEDACKMMFSRTIKSLRAEVIITLILTLLNIKFYG